MRLKRRWSLWGNPGVTVIRHDPADSNTQAQLTPFDGSPVRVSVLVCAQVGLVCVVGCVRGCVCVSVLPLPLAPPSSLQRASVAGWCIRWHANYSAFKRGLSWLEVSGGMMAVWRPERLLPPQGGNGVVMGGWEERGMCACARVCGGRTCAHKPAGTGEQSGRKSTIRQLGGPASSPRNLTFIFVNQNVRHVSGVTSQWRHSLRHKLQKQPHNAIIAMAFMFLHIPPERLNQSSIKYMV